MSRGLTEVRIDEVVGIRIEPGAVEATVAVGRSKRSNGYHCFRFTEPRKHRAARVTDTCVPRNSGKTNLVILDGRNGGRSTVLVSFSRATGKPVGAKTNHPDLSIEHCLGRRRTCKSKWRNRRIPGEQYQSDVMREGGALEGRMEPDVDDRSRLGSVVEGNHVPKHDLYRFGIAALLEAVRGSDYHAWADQRARAEDGGSADERNHRTIRRNGFAADNRRCAASARQRRGRKHKYELEQLQANDSAC